VTGVWTPAGQTQGRSGDRGSYRGHETLFWRRLASRVGFGGLTALIVMMAWAPSGASAQTLRDEIPAGCPPAPVLTAVFVGRLDQRDLRAGRFEVLEVRSGSLAGYQVAGLVDVDYFEDVRFLDPGQSYLVGVAPDPITGRLGSKVRAPEPRFGGNQVVALDEVTCPVFEDPVVTLLPDGSSVESGVLTPLFDRPGRILLALVAPGVWAFGVLVVLAVAKLLVVSALNVLVRRSAPARRVSAAPTPHD
jgi:hypothetical protein